MPTATKITFLDAASVEDLPAFDTFNELGHFTAYSHTKPDDVVDRAGGAQVVIVNKVRLTAEIIGELPDLRLICVAATGVNNVDKEAAGERNIPIRNVAGYSTDSVAQLAMTSLLAMAMDLPYLNEAVYNGAYSKAKDFTLWRHPFYELGHARFGIIGLGTIGRRVAQLAEAYGAKVVYHSTSGTDHDVPYPRLELDELLSSCQVVSIHCALTEATEGLIGYNELKRMSPSAYLVNVARGGIVVEADLARAIDEGVIAGAAVDVFTQEPLPGSHPYLSVKNRHRLFLTPHVGWASVEARTRLLAGIRDNIREGW
ncbi:glycerate dehydrogenase [Neolewinella xylanilytica]|uniref:Glycerate dehydrogenase n=1 Tax=Neolewinella xylanilytica TaxID=1514080 RepID=A0A2S6IAQ4_9BACT|nr:NAD(P)-dependent oxidoreductase [Neolewinella xylanilytica]PPK88587.1 glycerate dehydrogenase [Neolewinella xylanilytica]